MRFLLMLAAAAATGLSLLAEVPLDQETARRIRRMEIHTRDNPRDIGSFHDLAQLYRDAEMWDQAIAAETQAVTLHPKYAVAFYGRGKAYMGKQEYALARQDFNTALNFWTARGLERFLTVERPFAELIDGFRTRGMAAAHLGDYPAAIDDVTTAMRLAPSNARLAYERGHLRAKSGRAEDAAKDFYDSGYLSLANRDYDAVKECLSRLDQIRALQLSAQLRAQLASAQRPRSDLP